MDTTDIKHTNFSVSDYLGWARDGSLDLSPAFQRRSVWKVGAKSYLLDTVLRGLPTPLIFLRERIDLETLKHRREVIDGQQRLRTLVGFIDESALSDFSPERDRFVGEPQHNAALAGKRWRQLNPDLQQRILSYEFSTHVLPSTTESRDVLTIFARLNSTGTPLNHQELRNAKYFGVFKTLMYQLAYEQLERWLDWRVFDPDALSRMQEVEFTSDLAANILDGLHSKSQARLNKTYQRYDEALPHADELARRFRDVMDGLEELLGGKIRQSVYRSQVHFFTLFTYAYDEMYGLGSSLAQSKKPKRMASGVDECLLEVSRQFRAGDVPEEILDAVQRASTDLGRRRARLQYLKSHCGDKAA